jgi:hypothetical protein
MGPDELALLQVLLQSGYTEEQAMQILMQGSVSAPASAGQVGSVFDQLQQGVANNYAGGPPPSIDFTPPPPPPPQPSQLSMADTVYEDGSSNLFSDPGVSETGQFPNMYPPQFQGYAGPRTMGGYGPTGGGFGPDGYGGVNTPHDPAPRRAERLPLNVYSGAGAMGMPMGMGVPVGGVNPNAYGEKERSYGGDMRDVQTYGRDFSGDLGAIIRELVNAGRSAAAAQRPNAQRNPSRPSSPGRSASAPGQMKKAAGVQSAKSFTPAATRNTQTRTSAPAPAKARTITAPVTKPAAPKPPTPKGSVVTTRGKAIANTITKPKSRF